MSESKRKKAATMQNVDYVIQVRPGPTTAIHQPPTSNEADGFSNISSSTNSCNTTTSATFSTNTTNNNNNNAHYHHAYNCYHHHHHQRGRRSMAALNQNNGRTVSVTPFSPSSSTLFYDVYVCVHMCIQLRMYVSLYIFL